MYSKSLWFDIEHVRDALGWQPQWSNEEMLADSYDWFLRNRAEHRRRRPLAPPHDRQAGRAAGAEARHQSCCPASAPSRRLTWPCSAARIPRAEASHVSVRARASAAAASVVAPVVVEQHVGHRLAEPLERCQHAGHAVDDAAAMPADVGGHGGRAARRSLGDGQPPSLGQRCAADQPRPLVQGDELGVGQATGQA